MKIIFSKLIGVKAFIMILFADVKAAITFIHSDRSLPKPMEVCCN